MAQPTGIEPARVEPIGFCDQYSAMKGKAFIKFLKERNVRIEYICVDSPESNGSIERTLMNLGNAIRCKLYERSYACAWTTIAKEVVDNYNDTIHSVTGFTPSYLLKEKISRYSPFEEELVEIEVARELANERSEKKHRENAKYYNRNRRLVKIEEGHKVYCKIANKLNRKPYNPIYEGPFEVKKVHSNSRIEIEGKRVIVNMRNVRVALNIIRVDDE